MKQFFSYLSLVAVFAGLLPALSSKAQGLGSTPPKDNSGVQNNTVFTLAQCLAYAYHNQDSIKNASLDIKIATETVKETVGRGLPNISLNASGINNAIIAKQLVPGEFFGKPKGTFVPIAFGVPFQASYTAQATQLLFDASYLVGLRAAKVVKDLSTKAYTRTKIQIAVEVTKAFYNVLASRERIQLTDNSLARIEKNLSDTRALNKSGFAEKIDAQRIEVQYNNALTEKKQAVNGLLVALYALKFQMGMPLETSLNISGSANDVDLRPLADTVSLPYQNRIEYSLFETQLESQRLQWQNSKAALYPRLTASGNYGRSWFSSKLSHLFDVGFPASLIAVNFTWNIFDGSQTIHRINESRFAYEKGKNNLDALKKGLQFQVETSRVTYMNNLSTIESQARNRELSQQVYNTAKIKYTQGLGSSLELNDAEISLREAETNYISALLNLLISRVDLDQALGTIKL